MDAAFRKGDHARAKEIMQALWPAMNVLESGKFVQKLKYGCALLGNPVGDCRMPLGPLTDAEKAEFSAAMHVVIDWK
jgi:4-hydroxy-tetrahydrodipicolinate synthase